MKQDGGENPGNENGKQEIIEAEIIHRNTQALVSNETEMPPVPQPPELPKASRIDEEGLKRSLILHPFSGILILFLDYSFFGLELPVITIPLAILLSFILCFAGVFLIQRYIDEESTGKSVAKAFFSAVITAIPTPVFGTIFGSIILAVSGLNWLGKFINKK
ncbi:MAG: hypothetical protein A2017_12220 [Lentisphaerae bacterium GWF2_44_16]|nr:MAG: hypothetical protein A2017_12220 [Lentisphaerae bacterium GWF2_44_16]